MLAFTKHHDLRELDARLRDAHEVTAGLLSEILAETDRRFAGRAKTARIERLIQSEAWTDAALALIDLELPQWQVRRIAYDQGEWHCALSRQRELPEWLDQSIETHHADLPLAILRPWSCAAPRAASNRTSVPITARGKSALPRPVLTDLKPLSTPYCALGSARSSDRPAKMANNSDAVIRRPYDILYLGCRPLLFSNVVCRLAGVSS